MKVKLGISKPSRKNWTVKGKGIEEVFANLKKHGFWGRYRSVPSYKASDERVIYSTVKISARQVITMPSWSGYGKADKEAKKSWDTMYKALLKHEAQHGEIFEAAVQELKSQIEAGEDLDKKQIDEACDAFTTDVQKQQDKYDSSTKHGTSEGVILNIP
jgi:predicted secreted Zn-dependent protease